VEDHLSPDQEAFIREAIAQGRYRTPEDAVLDALACWEEGERRRVELMAALDEAEADLRLGQYTDYTNETLTTLAEELKHEARARRDDLRG
jgi:Arc/MetJ-type ribon-helix-helix transcriptional regulator